jgi:hypothetical protein
VPLTTFFLTAIPTGECECFPGYGSSDGRGRKGNNRDCGYLEPILGRAEE